MEQAQDIDNVPAPAKGHTHGNSTPPAGGEVTTPSTEPAPPPGRPADQAPRRVTGRNRLLAPDPNNPPLTVAQLKGRYAAIFPSETSQVAVHGSVAGFEEFLAAFEQIRCLTGFTAHDMYAETGLMAMKSRLLGEKLGEGDECCPSWLLKEHLRPPSYGWVRFADDDDADDARKEAWKQAVKEWRRRHGDKQPTMGDLLETPDGVRGDPRVYADWPGVDPSRVVAAVKTGFKLSNLRELSPSKPTGHQAADFVEMLFSGNVFVCCGRNAWTSETQRRLDWTPAALVEMQFVVPTRMTRKWGTTLGGRRSQHTMDNTAATRDWLVVEIDLCEADESGRPLPEAPAFRLARKLGMNVQDMCASVLQRLFAGDQRPALIVDSAGKSLHAWFNWRGRSAVEAEEFLREACLLGADPVTWRRSQFVRMPGGRRGDRVQEVVYLDRTQL